jgi:hypothetical protein
MYTTRTDLEESEDVGGKTDKREKGGTLGK